jgi:hypothetical protein
VLRSAPMRRANIQLKEALQPASGHRSTFQQTRFNAALESLDEAESLAAPEELPNIVFLKALTTSMILGADEATLCNCDRFQGLAEDVQKAIAVEMANNDRRLRQHLARLAKMKPVDSPRGGGGLVGWDGTVDPLARRGYEMKAASRQRYGEQLKAAYEETKWARATLNTLRIAVLTRKGENQTAGLES